MVLKGYKMNHAVIFNFLGNLLKFLGLMMFAPLFVAVYYGESLLPFGTAIIVTGIVGVVCTELKGNGR